jgi:hypothetical protein
MQTVRYRKPKTLLKGSLWWVMVSSKKAREGQEMMHVYHLLILRIKRMQVNARGKSFRRSPFTPV